MMKQRGAKGNGTVHVQIEDVFSWFQYCFFLFFQINVNTGDQNKADPNKAERNTSIRTFQNHDRTGKSWNTLWPLMKHRTEPDRPVALTAQSAQLSLAASCASYCSGKASIQFFVGTGMKLT